MEGSGIGDLANIFVNNEYERVDVNGRMVIDIGASIGDSSVYFAKKGAEKVIALEPNQETYTLAKKNVGLNGFSKIIEISKCRIRAPP